MIHSDVFSFFSGVGFLDLGFEDAGFNVVYASEIFPPFMEAYRYSRTHLKRNLPEYGCYCAENGDIQTLLNPEEKYILSDLVNTSRQNADLVGFIGGPPCPDFSVGGKNKGKEGEKGKLSASYVQLICEHQPDFFVFENVKGLWRTLKHRTFYEDLKRILQNAGYVLTEKLINSLEYGVPQDRERIILIGFHRHIFHQICSPVNIHFRDVFPETIFPWDKFVVFPKTEVFSYPWPKFTPFQADSSLDCPPNLPQELTVEYWFKRNQTENHLNAEGYFKPRGGIEKMKAIPEGDDSKKSYKRLHRWRYSPTACYGNNEVHLHPYKVRRLSVAEAIAIQSLPKDFVLPPELPLSHLFKSIGNGVPYLASLAIAKTILYFLNHPGIDEENRRQQVNDFEPLQLSLNLEM